MSLFNKRNAFDRGCFRSYYCESRGVLGLTSWVKSLFLALLLTCSLSACGFTPVYSNLENSTTGINLSNVQIANIPNWQGQYLRNQLIDKMYKNGRPQNARYILKVSKIETKTQDLGIDKDAIATRQQLIISTSFDLVDNKDGKILLSRKIRSINGYNILDNHLSNKSTYQNAEKRGLVNLSTQIENQLNLYLIKQTRGV